MQKNKLIYIAFNIMLSTFLVVLAVLYTGCPTAVRRSEDEEDDSSPPPDETYDEVIDVKVGDKFTISRRSNPSTGYEWELEFDSYFIKLESKVFLPDNNLIGSPGTDKCTFTALKIAQTEIKMTYKRPWEDEIIDEYLVLVRIT